MRVLALICLLLATACSNSNLEALRSTPPKGTPFQAALATRYLRLSEEKAIKYNWVASSRFADKGLDAAYGHDVAPETVEDWPVPENTRPALLAARAALEDVLKAGREANPEEAATAQASFDCWLQHQSADWQPAEIAYCRDNFEQALQTLATATVPVEEAAPAGAAETTEKPEEPAPALKENYIVFFATDHDDLDDAAARVVESLAQDLLKQNATYNVTVNGHTDATGTRRHNFDLSRRRAQSVLKVLNEHGVPLEVIHPYAFGETDPAVPTADGVDEPKNRRVEIYIGDE